MESQRLFAAPDLKGLPWGYTIGAILTVLLARFLYRGYQVRKRFHHSSRLPGHSWLWGHLHLMPKVQSVLPKNVPPTHLLYELAKQHGLDDSFYIFDPWPVADPILISCSPAISDQFTMQRSMPKFKDLASFIWPVTGMQNLVVDDGQRWKTWRSAFNPGFSNAHLMTLVPDIVDAIDVFCGKLEKLAGAGKPFRIEGYVTRLTIDVISKVVLDMELNSQVKEHELVHAFEESIRWLPVGPQYKPSELWDIRRPFVLRQNQKTMDRLIDGELKKRWATRNVRTKSKYVVDLALETYLKDAGKIANGQSELDDEFRLAAINQVKTFLFAGHETSASTISYCLYYLAKMPEVAAKVTAELESVYGKGTNVGQRIKEDPTLINKTEYLIAVVKEALRMHSPANSVRQGSKDFFIVDPKTGEKYNTDGLGMVAMVNGDHYHAGWGDPYVFRPERWVDKDVLEGAWVPFSKAPRSCIGQELALIEIRMVVAMALRQFSFKSCYDELEALKGDGSSYASDATEKQDCWGCEAFQVGTTAKPRGGMPMSVYRRP